MDQPAVLEEAHQDSIQTRRNCAYGLPKWKIKVEKNPAYEVTKIKSGNKSRRTPRMRP